MKNKLPGVPVREGRRTAIPHYLLGGDNLARDVFSRVVTGSVFVIAIAPLATIVCLHGGDHAWACLRLLCRPRNTIVFYLAAVNLVLAFQRCDPVVLPCWLYPSGDFSDRYPVGRHWTACCPSSRT